MKNIIRLSIALDDETYRILKNLKALNVSQSEIVRRALRFYNTFASLGERSLESMKIYSEMLKGGEHVILDLDHLLTILRLLEASPQRDNFWEEHRRIARSHADQFRYYDLEKILIRLEACNFFRLIRLHDEYVLIFGNEEIRKFIGVFLQEILDTLTINAQIKEELTKIRVALVK